jgi:hypothetical protein
MWACTQPGCAGTIVDGYCDVCGSPAGVDADPFVPAATGASATSPAPTDAHGLTAVRREPGVPTKPKSGGLITACTQPGCISTIVDNYCEVCGSPAGAAPFVAAAASSASPTPADEPGRAAVPPSTPPPASVDEEIPTHDVVQVHVSRYVAGTRFESKPWCKSGMVYKWLSTDICERCFGVQRHRLPISGARIVGHDIVTEHRVLPNLRQWIHDQVAQLAHTDSGRGHAVRASERGGRHDGECKACGTKWQRRQRQSHSDGAGQRRT